MKYIFYSIVFFAFITSCKKEKIKSVQTNNSADSLTYQPKVSGSKWSYNMTLGGVTTVTYNSTRLDYDTTINKKIYNVFDSESQGLQYTRQDSSKYYSVLTTSTNNPELLVLDITKNINDVWIGGTVGDDTYTYTMKEKIPIYKLDGFTFKNVLKVYQERKDKNNKTTLSGDTYYAQGIGQVLTDGTINGISVYVKLIKVALK